MAIKSYFFNAVKVGDTYDRTYNAEDFASYLSKLVSNGVFASPSNNLQVVSDNGLNIIVKVGEGWINGHKMVNTADLPLSVESSDVILNRKDYVIFYLDNVNRNMGIEVKKGTPAQSPTAPALIRNNSRYELALAEITLAKGQSSITASSIKDLRGYSSLCGYVRSLIDSTDATTLFNQWDGQFKEWWESVKHVLNTESQQFGVASFNGRGGVVLSQVGDYTSEQVIHGGNTTLKQAVDGKVDLAGGNISNTIISTLANVTDNFPIPLSGDKTNTAMGKVVKFFNDLKTWMGKVVLKSHIVDNTTSTRADLPLSANQGKVMMDQINNLNNATGAKTYTKFTAKPSDWLGKGSPFSNVDINNSFSYAPPTRAGSVAFYTVITFGTATRCTQIAFYAFSSATVDQGSIFFRRQHDTSVSGWMKVL